MTDHISVFRSPEREAQCYAAYDAVLGQWLVPHEELDLPTRFGTTHIITGGSAGAKPIILLHGQDSSATSWIYNIAGLSRVFRTYAVDTIGDMGKSRPTCLLKNRDDYAGWLLEVLQGLEIEKADLMGFSYGGFLAVDFALAQPERVNRIVLLAPGIPNFGSPTLRWAGYGIPMMLWPSRFTVKRFINGASTRGYSREDPVLEQMIIGMINMRHASFMRPEFTDEELKRMTLPILFLIGDHEIMYKPGKALDRAKRLIPNLQAEIIPNAGHMLNYDQPEKVNVSIAKYLAGESDGET